MPISQEIRRAAGKGYQGVFEKQLGMTEAIEIDVSDLTDDEVDADGMLKPGVPFKSDGTLLDGTTDEELHGVTIEATKIASGNTSAILDAAADIPVTLERGGLINRDRAEDQLGRAYTANELAAFGGSMIRLTLT